MPDRESDLRIAIEELSERMMAGEDFAFIDVRNPHAWAESHVMIPNAIRVPLNGYEQHLEEIPRNEAVIAYCT